MDNKKFKQYIPKSYTVRITYNGEGYVFFAPYSSSRLTKRVLNACFRAVKESCDKIGVPFSNNLSWKVKDLIIEWKLDEEYSSYISDDSSGGVKTANLYVCKLNENY